MCGLGGKLRSEKASRSNEQWTVKRSFFYSRRMSNLLGLDREKPSWQYIYIHIYIYIYVMLIWSVAKSTQLLQQNSNIVVMFYMHI